MAADGPGVYLVKDSDELVSHCRCERALAACPGQLSCPWCGCGWMLSCMECRRAFSFARGERIDDSWDELAHRDLRGMGIDPTDETVAEWIEQMKELLAGVEEGRRYVYFDGAYIPADAGPIRHDGWFAHHDLPLAPQTAALANRKILDEILTNRRYWLASERTGEPE